MKIIEKLTKLPLFNNFDYFNMKMLYLNSLTRSYIKGDYIYKEKDDVDAIYLIKNGEINVLI